MISEYSLFSYKCGNSFLHRCPFYIKFFFIPIINISFLLVPFECLVAFVLLQFVLSFFLKFSIKEQFYDLRLVIYYALLQYVFYIFSWFGSLTEFEINIQDLLLEFAWEKQKLTVIYLIRILALFQCTSLIFKTSTSLEMKEGISKIFGQKTLITITLFMFINFIPIVSKIWNDSKKVWYARGGKTGIKMYTTLFSILFSVGMKKAYNTSRAFILRI